MAQTITTISPNGLFKANKINYYTITSDSFNVDLTGEQGGVTLFADVPATTNGSYELVFQRVNGGSPLVIPLVSKAPNVIYLTTHGFKKNDGFVDFKITSSTGDIVPASGIKLCFIKHVSVVNH